MPRPRSLSAACISILAMAAVPAACRPAQPPDAFTRAAFEGHTAEVVAALGRADHDPCDALVWAARGGRPGPILAVTSRGVNPDGCHRGVNGWTPLMHAVHKNHHRAVRALLRSGASANPPADPHALTPLMMAAGNGSFAIVKALIGAGADPRVTRPDGTNALTLALAGGALMDMERPLGECHPEIIKLLLTSAPDLRVTASPRNRLSRAIAHVNGCDQALTVASR